MDSFSHQVFVINKETGPSSFEIVRRFRRATGLRKVGHTGTLDPLASGVMILCTGSATRAAEHFVNLEKEYEFEVTLGVETSTLDAEGDVVRELPVPNLTIDHVKDAAQTFEGTCTMTPPPYSAIKRGGRRMYERARSGEEVVMPSRDVYIASFDILSMELPRVRCRVRCSRGTYVRSLARVLGEKLGTCGYITELIRTRVGSFTLDHAFPSTELGPEAAPDLSGLALGDALHFLPGVVLSRKSQRALQDGTRPGLQDVVRVIGALGHDTSVRILDEEGGLIAVGRRRDLASHDRLFVVDSYRMFAEPTATGGAAA